MEQATKAKVLKYLRTTHAWLGIIVLPWIFVIGFTGFYLNHSKAISGFIQSAEFDEFQFSDWPNAQEVSMPEARLLVATIWPEESVNKVIRQDYHDRASFFFHKESGQIIVSHATGHYFVKTLYTRKTYAPDGALLHSKFYWGTLFKVMHTRGWFTLALGTWLADFVSISLIVFSTTGIFLWWMPRAKKIKRKFRRS